MVASFWLGESDADIHRPLRGAAIRNCNIVARPIPPSAPGEVRGNAEHELQGNSESILGLAQMPVNRLGAQ